MPCRLHKGQVHSEGDPVSIPGLLWPALWGGDQQGQQRALQCRGGLLGPQLRSGGPGGLQKP